MNNVQMPLRISTETPAVFLIQVALVQAGQTDQRQHLHHAREQPERVADEHHAGQRERNRHFLRGGERIEDRELRVDARPVQEVVVADDAVVRIQELEVEPAADQLEQEHQPVGDAKHGRARADRSSGTRCAGTRDGRARRRRVQHTDRARDKAALPPRARGDWRPAASSVRIDTRWSSPRSRYCLRSLSATRGSCRASAARSAPARWCCPRATFSRTSSHRMRRRSRASCRVCRHTRAWRTSRFQRSSSARTTFRQNPEADAAAALAARSTAPKRRPSAWSSVATAGRSTCPLPRSDIRWC